MRHSHNALACIVLVLLLAAANASFQQVSAFQLTPLSPPLSPSAAAAARTNNNNNNNNNNRAGRAAGVAPLCGKAWSKLGIDEDADFHWYMLNCVAGLELELLAQCRRVQPELRPQDCRKFVVPQERQLRSHGKRNVVDVKALYPGYVFANLRLCPDVYEKIQAIPLTRSWMGTVHMKGMRKLPVIPVALGDDEIAKFQLLEAETDALFAKYGDDYDGRGDVGDDLLDQYAGYEVDGMVKVLKGKHKGEDAVVKRLKDGKIKVRLYTYGTTYDEWYDVSDIRPMTDAEVLKGLTGPDGPIRQDDFDVSIGKKPKDYQKRGSVDDRSGRSLRNDLYNSMGGGGGGGNRNTRADRQARGARGNRDDRFGRSDAQLEEEERNWREYREQQRQQRGQRQQGAWGMKGAKPDWTYEDTRDVTDGDYDDENILGDADAQWGRQAGGDVHVASGRQERRMRRGGRQWQDAGPSSSSNQRGSQSRGIESALEGDDDWTSFAAQGSGGASGGGGSESDDFFDSLLNELSDALDSSGNNADAGADADYPSRPSQGGTPAASGGNNDDDFFSSLIDDLSDGLEGDGGSNDGPSSSSSSSGGAGSGTADDDFFASLEADLDDVLGATSRAGGADTSSSDDDFFNDLADDLFATDELASKVDDKLKQTSTIKGSSASSSSSSSEDLSSLTVPVLKGMLKERGLKVSGKKSDLIDRLQSS